MESFRYLPKSDQVPDPPRRTGVKAGWGGWVLGGGYLLVVVALLFGFSGANAEFTGRPTCDGEPMSPGDTCRVTIQQGTDLEIDHYTYEERLAIQQENVRVAPWLRGMIAGTVGAVLVFVGVGRVVAKKRPAQSVALRAALAASTLPLLVATAVVGWLELRYAPGERPGILFLSNQDIPVSLLAMAGLVGIGTLITLAAVGAQYEDPATATAPAAPPAAPAPAPPAGAAVRLPEEAAPAAVPAGPWPAPWWRRVAARLVDAVILAVILLVTTLIVAALTFLVARPIMGESAAGTLNSVLTMALVVLVSLLYEVAYLTQHGATYGKALLGLRVVRRDAATAGAGGLPAGAAVLRAIVWWGPVFLTGFPTFGPVPVLLWLLVLPLVNGILPLLDRAQRRSLGDWLTGTAVQLTPEAVSQRA